MLVGCAQFRCCPDISVAADASHSLCISPAPANAKSRSNQESSGAQEVAVEVKTSRAPQGTLTLPHWVLA
jgi:hypothetical protein